MNEQKQMNFIVKLIAKNQNETEKLNAGQIREVVRIIKTKYALIRYVTMNAIKRGVDMKATKKTKATKKAAKPVKKAGK